MRILPRFRLPLAILILFLPLYGQGLPSSLRTQKNSGSENDNTRVLRIMEMAEQHYKLGELNLKDNNIDAARIAFNQALDSVLESGMDVREHPKLQTFYLQLVERVYRMELAMRPAPRQDGQQPDQFIAASPSNKSRPQPQPGFLREQKFEPSPLDELSRLELVPEKFPNTKQLSCTAINSASIKLRGFNLGMSIAEVKRRLPGLRLTASDPYGRSMGSILNIGKVKPALLNGVGGISFTFLDGRVTYIGVGYDDSIRWSDLDEFVIRTAEALSLPSRWESYAHNYEPRRGLICDSFLLTAEFMNPYSKRRPLLRLTDRAAAATYDKRVEAAIEKRQIEEQRKRQTFKP